MQCIKTFLVWLFFGYSNKAVITNLNYNKINLFFLGINDEISEFELFIPDGIISKGNSSCETYKVFENKGNIYMKPKIDTKIFYKALFMYPIVGIFMEYNKENGIIWAIIFSLFVNLFTWFNQLKNHKILKLKIQEVKEHINYLKYLKNKRLKLAIERLYNFENRNKSEYEIYLQNQDIDFVNKTLNDGELLSGWDSKFVNNLSIVKDNFIIQKEVYEVLVNYLEEYLRDFVNTDFRSRSLKILKTKVDSTMLKDLSFFEK
jgi:hypothetical protein